ncbi:MAG: 4Fe-4S binding protein [Deltaproteobacteria bacterium]|nr:4Fe-4S binding protein [Deltaproteobacteria bacterium]
MRRPRSRKIVQAACLVFFAAFLAFPGLLSWADFSFGLLPSAGAGRLAARMLGAGLVFFLLFMVSGLLVGRAFCGWVCPLGTLSDGVNWVAGKKPRGRRLAPARHAVAAGLWVAAAPAALGFSAIFYLAPLAWASRLGAALPGLKPDPMGLLAVLSVFAGIEKLLGRRGFCRVVCPAGTTLGWAAAASPYAPRRGEGCTDCGKCASLCFTGALGRESYRPSMCLHCRECVEQCPSGALSFGWGKPFPADASRRSVLAALAGGAVAGALLAKAAPAKASAPAPVRPPGAVSEDVFSDLCVRCGSCVRACPTGGIVAAGPAHGARMFQTPILSGRDGGCDYLCNACTAVCPTGALSPLSLEAKQKAKIARVDLDRRLCLPFSRGYACLCCFAACPTGAVRLEPSGRALPWGDPLFYPKVDQQACIGCGLCQAACPVAGDGAVRISPDQKEA